MLEDKSLEEVQDRLFKLPTNHALWGLNVPTYNETSCWPKNIWEPEKNELKVESVGSSDRTFRVSLISSESVTAVDVSDGSRKLRIDWPGGALKIGDELTVSIRARSHT